MFLPYTIDWLIIFSRRFKFKFFLSYLMHGSIDLDI